MAARGASATSNFVTSALFAAGINGLNSMFSTQKFLSKDTLVSTTAITGVSVIMHLLTSSKRPHTPNISYAPAYDTPCSRKKSWAERAQDDAQTEIAQR